MVLRSFSTLPRGSLFAHGEVDLKVDSNSGPAKNGKRDIRDVGGLLSAEAWPAGKLATRMQHVRRITQEYLKVHSRDAGHTADQAASHLSYQGFKGCIISDRTEEIIIILTCRVSPTRAADDDHEASSMAFLRPLPRQFHMSPRAGEEAWRVASAAHCVAALSSTHTATIAIVLLSLRHGHAPL